MKARYIFKLLGITIFSLLLLNSLGIAQIHYDSAGNVGIGTTSPQSRLHLVGSFGIANQTDSYRRGFISMPNTSDMIVHNGWGNLSLESGSSLVFTTWDGPNAGDYSEKVRITNSGNVGIGTTEPTAKLHVTDDTTNGTDNVSLRLEAIDNNGQAWEVVSSGGWGISSGSFGIRDVNSGFRVIVDDSGNVGIGTTEPTAKLDVNGDISQPTGGWKKIGQDRYTYTRYWNWGQPPPDPSGDHTIINIGGPIETTSGTRDKFWTGTITVAARTGGNVWDMQYFYYGNFWGHTIYGNDWELSPIKGSGLKMERPNDRSDTMNIIIPGTAKILCMVIHVDMFRCYLWGFPE